MGRPRKPIDDTGPVGQFATQLRDRQDQVPGLTFRAMASRAHSSHSVLAEAAGGKKFPTWTVTRAFLVGCGAGQEEIASWQERWKETNDSIYALMRKIGRSSVVVPTRSDAGPIRDGRLRPVKADLADPDQWRPQPDSVQTFDDLCYQLKVFKIAVGNPGLRDLNQTIAQLNKKGPRGFTSVSTLSEVFSGRRTPNFDLFGGIVTALIQQAPGIEMPNSRWLVLEAWREAWHRAEFNRQRPDLTRHRRFGNIFLVADAKDEGPTASIVAEMDAQVAAALLASLPPAVASTIITGLPTPKAQAVLNAMVALTGGTAAVRPPEQPRDEGGISTAGA
jgi:hypothetical protein